MYHYKSNQLYHNMVIKSAQFKCSSEKVGQCPAEDIPDFAFIGRSNVGKSSLVNMLTGIKGLAKVSSTPGKTRLINHFIIDESWYLVDLPGYGYAKTSRANRREFSKLVTDYVTKHENLCFLFVLIDARHKPQKIDLDFMDFLSDNEIPFGIIFTKADKLKARECKLNIEFYTKELLETWQELPRYFVSSSQTHSGKEEIINFIGETLLEVTGKSL